jgi:hypothetical protein
MVRMHHLKKFFQSKTFIEVTHQAARARISESSAALGAFCAGMCGMVAEQFGQNTPLVSSSSSFWFIAIPALIYVLRDRIKDWAKAGFQRRASAFFPDLEKALMADGKRIGTSREWFRVMDFSDLPAEVQQARRCVDDPVGHPFVPEEAIHWKQEQKLEAVEDSKWSLTETIRLNLDRYLKLLDDPLKEITLLDDSGALVQCLSRRVYHFHLMLCFDRQSPSIYRVIVDKQGIDRVEYVYGPQQVAGAPQA